MADISIEREILTRAAGPGFNLDQADGYFLRSARLSRNSPRPFNLHQGPVPPGSLAFNAPTW
jgi:hypothetical protein